jgi:hypothetical protein
MPAGVLDITKESFIEEYLTVLMSKPQSSRMLILKSNYSAEESTRL